MSSSKKAIIILEFDNIWCNIKAGPNILRYIDDKLSFMVPGANFSKAYRSGMWDGTKRFLKLKSGMVQTGLIPYIIEFLPLDELNIKVIDRRILPRSDFSISKIKMLDVEEWTRTLDHVHFRSNIKKNSYQVNAINSAIHNSVLNQHWPRGVVGAATGSGKSLVSAGIAKTLGLPLLFTVHRLDLVNQTKDTFEQILGEKVGQIGGGKCELDYKYTVSSVQTIYSRIKTSQVEKFLRTIKVWIVDESHCVSDNSYYKVSNKLPNAYFRFGMTGSAFKKSQIDNMFMRSVLGEVVFKLPSKSLIKNKLLIRPIINMLEGGFSGNIVKSGTVSYDTYYDQLITQNESRNMLIAKVAQSEASKGAKVLILVSRIAHGELLQAIINPFLQCQFISGDTDLDGRKLAVKRFKSPVCNVLIASTIFDQGIDIPEISSIIMAGAGKSPVAIIQRVGRGLRTSPGLDVVNIWDFYDRSHPFDGHVRSRMKIYSEEGWDLVFKDVS